MNFKRVILAAFLALAASPVVYAQSADSSINYVRPQTEQTTASSHTVLSLGLGFGGYYPYTAAIYEENPNLTLMVRHALFNHVGPGHIAIEGLVSYKSIYSGYTDTYTNYYYEQRWNYYIFGGRLSYHVSPLGSKKIDMYAGVMEAYYLTKFKFSSNDPDFSDPADPGYSLKYSYSPNFFAPSVFLGIRSWVTNHSSVWMEIGYGYTSVAFGASYKL